MVRIKAAIAINRRKLCRGRKHHNINVSGAHRLGERIALALLVPSSLDGYWVLIDRLGGQGIFEKGLMKRM